LGSDVFYPLDLGVKLTYNWIKSEVDNLEKNTKWIYESPDGGKTIYKRKPNDTEKYKINK
jgi:hypothetical protein